MRGTLRWRVPTEFPDDAVFAKAPALCLTTRMNDLRRLGGLILVHGLLAAGRPGQAAPADWAGRFAQPPANGRFLKIIHGWPDKAEAQDALIGTLQTQGFGGVVCNVSFDQYLESEAKWEAFTRAVQAARRAGLAMWLYDERGYPSGNAGGLTLRDHPEWEARGLLVADTETRGGAVELELPPGKLVLAGAFPVRDGQMQLAQRVDLAAQLHSGKLSWRAPAGSWRLLAITENRLYEGTHADGNLWARIPYINLLLPEPTARFAEVTYGGYARHLGDDLGRYFMATFTDEPSLMSLFLKPMPYRPLPWGSNLPVAFKRRRGYPLDAALLPALVGEAGPRTAQIRHDFWLTVGELVAENYFGQLQTQCRRHHLPSGGHLLMEETLAAHVALYGDFFRCIRRLDAPSIDCLTSLPPEVPWQIARLLASAAELEGRTLVMSETSDHSQRYRPAGDQRPTRSVTEHEVRGTCNRELVAGVNCITSYYSFADLAPDQLRRLNEWVGRCCAALRGGHQVADIAVLYPAESLWTKFVPSRHGTQEAAAASQIASLCRSAADNLFASQRDFTFVDSRALTEARAQSGTLAHGSLRWRAVVLPGADTLPLAAWKNLARFVRGGGAVVALGALPANSERDFPSARVRKIAQEIFGVDGAAVRSLTEPRSRTNAAGGIGVYLPRSLEELLPAVLNGLLEPDVAVAPAKSPVRVTHRRLDDREVYFLINDSPKPWAGEARFAAAGDGERWEPATGRRAAAVEAGAVKLELAPYDAAVFRFATARPPARRPGAGVAWPALYWRPVPRAEPTVPHGEFVQGDLALDPAHSRADSPAWQATAILTKTGVDTHLFTRFLYAQPLDLKGADCLAIETWVPAGQTTPSQLLVILHEEGGGDFLAETARSLATPGRQDSLVPWSRFHLAGWSKDADGELNLTRVSEIRIGWGGYFGTEGEKIQFSVALPRTGSIAARAKQ